MCSGRWSLSSVRPATREAGAAAGGDVPTGGIYPPLFKLHFNTKNSFYDRPNSLASSLKAGSEFKIICLSIQ